MFRGSCTAAGSGTAVLLVPSGTDEARSTTAGERRRKIIACQETLPQPCSPVEGRLLGWVRTPPPALFQRQRLVQAHRV
jgi:hypothetical protein